MLQTLTKKGLRGFTLIELLVVIAIIGLLSTVIAAPITEARKKGRDSKKISDLRAITTALSLYADDNAGMYPADLGGLVPRYLPNLPANAAAATNPRDKYMYVIYTDSGAASTTAGIAYHLGVKLEAGNQALADDADCDSYGDGATATGGSSKFCLGTSAAANAALKSCTGTCAASWANKGTQTGGAVVGTSQDFMGGSDTNVTQCTAALNNCIYDIVN